MPNKSPKKETKKVTQPKTNENFDGAVELFDEESVITLYDDNNKPIEFLQIAAVEYQEKFYALLQPVIKEEGIGEDEAAIMEYFFDEENEAKIFQPVFDENLLETVFNIYIKAVADYEFDPSDCCN
ncbi:MAG: DUF1292 domain-containing protein [Firmicutes bacterium]|nr:DUF1292 domain-containing protein [Bacillota bacterium]